MISSVLHWLDRRLFDWLSTNPALPVRLQKSLAFHYPDARIRKAFWAKLNVEMGEGTFPNPGLLVVNTMDAEARITIGRNVSIAPGVILVTDSSPSNSAHLMKHPAVASMIRRAPIVIGDDCWVGAGAVILPGVRVGKGAIVGAGAVVIEDVAADTVVAGVPARVLRSLEQGGQPTP